MAISTSWGYALEYASFDLQSDPGVVIEALNHGGHSFRFVSNACRLNREVAFAAVVASGDNLGLCSEELQADYDIVLAAVMSNGGALRFASKSLQADRRIVVAAIQKCGDPLLQAADALRSDRALVLQAVEKGPSARFYFEGPFHLLRNDRDFIKAAVSLNAEALRWAPECFQADRDIVCAAVAQKGSALRHAAQYLRADREIALMALADDGGTWEFIADDLLEEIIDDSGYDENGADAADNGSGGDVIATTLDIQFVGLDDDLYDERGMRCWKMQDMLQRYAKATLGTRVIQLDCSTVDSDRRFNIICCALSGEQLARFSLNAEDENDAVDVIRTRVSEALAEPAYLLHIVSPSGDVLRPYDRRPLQQLLCAK